MQLALEPPYRGMPTRNHKNQQLHGLGDVVASLHMCPFVNDDPIEVRLS
jgi:hypothetical protein